MASGRRIDFWFHRINPVFTQGYGDPEPVYAAHDLKRLHGRRLFVRAVQAFEADLDEVSTKKPCRSR